MLQGLCFQLLGWLVDNWARHATECAAALQRRAVKRRIGLDIRDPFFYPARTYRGRRTYTVISAVYGVEKYIEPMLSSLLRQTLDFRHHIQVILVDDGSEDGSTAICKRWAARFPDNIIYVRKENGGQASARNAGLPHATGDWITFIDADDLVDRNYFLNVEHALANEFDVDALDMVACNLTLFFTNECCLRKHSLWCQFRHGIRRVYLDGPGRDIHVTVNSAFFNKARLDRAGIAFADIRPVAEDLNFVARCLLASESPQILFVPKARYYYRKRGDGTSTMDKGWLHRGRYGVTLEAHQELFDAARVKYGDVPPWLQRMVLYDLSSHVKRMLCHGKAATLMPADMKAPYMALLHALFRQIDSDIIGAFKLSRIDETRRLAMLHLCHDAALERMQCIDGVRIGEFDPMRRQVRVSYYYIGRQPDTRVCIGTTPVTPLVAKTRTLRFVDEVVVRQYVAWFPWNGNGMLDLYVDGERMDLARGQRSKSSVTEIDHTDVLDAAFWPTRVKFRRWLAATDHYRARFHDAWLLMDRDTQADDNAEHLYRYLRASHPDINVWFALRKSSCDWQRLRRDGFRLVAFGSTEHAMALMNARHVVSSHLDPYVFRYLPPEYYADKLRWDFTFLRHGVSKDDLSNWLNGAPINHIVAASEREYEAICNDDNGYRFTTEDVGLTGFPRHDRLSRKRDDHVPKTVLIMPTWRSGLVGHVLGRTNERAYNDALTRSEFYRSWKALLTDPELVRLAESHGYRVVFFPHANLKPYLDDFRADGIPAVGHDDIDSIQDLFLDAAVMITDYSSVAFEMAYLERPVIYYQFDRDFVLGQGHFTEKGYFDYDRDGFGPVCRKQGELLQALAAQLGEGLKPQFPYDERMGRFFAYRDGLACKRVFDMISGAAVKHKRHDKISLNKRVRVWNSLAFIRAHRRGLTPFVLIVGKARKVDLGKRRWHLEVHGKRYQLQRAVGVSRIVGGNHWLVGVYKTVIDVSTLMDAGIHNRVWLRSESGQHLLRKPLYYNRLSKKVFYALFSGRIVRTGYGRSAYFRVTKGGQAVLTVRKSVMSDRAVYRWKIWAAWLAASACQWLPRRFRTILLFEKEGEKYEESASVVYERLLDLGRRNVRFVIAKQGLQDYSIPNKYRGRILLKGSFRHYFHFFLAKTFIGTEGMGHAVDLRTSHPAALHRIYHTRFDYVMLQHGVMYMVSLDCRGRSAFRKRNGIFPRQGKIVVSSALEADHFVTKGGFDPKDIYITGLPKFDRAMRKHDADKIIIMPTWRPWEYNIIASDHESSSYYEMLKTLLAAVPARCRSRVIIMPHPLVRDELKQSGLADYIIPDLSYEHALQQCAMLVTDYSSIAYDAFNRGAKVVFWWADKERCMRRYGARLMLTEAMAFGPVAYREDALQEAMERYIDGPIPDSYEQKFRQLVNDFQRRSTDLLIERMQQDNIM